MPATSQNAKAWVGIMATGDGQLECTLARLLASA